ncbi:ABC transporter ATP-binding protein [Paenibacillus thermotolerans]|uniref:ABC transporter ATP-binding protein n=1 Tax=Paenibacillus thermotolerans TaxID=3027807 RepID=UPI002368EF11|nr:MULTISPECIES: ABC transporter ATP-binding protein [unclassified Paenibacillus]
MNHVIELSNVEKSYKDVHAVKGISLTVGAGEIFGIVGPNGAGKTTTVEMMEGLRKPDRGQIRVLGLDPVTNAYEVKQRIGIQLQSTSIPDKAKVGETIKLFASFYRTRTDIAKLLDKLQLTDKLDRYVSKLSGGWKQRVTLALALVNDPEVVFLDEPSMGLDPNARKEMWELIRQLKSEGRTIVMTTHYMEEAEALCDRIAIIDQGKLVALDSAQGLMSTADENSTITFVPYPVSPAQPADADRLLRLTGVTQATSTEDGRIALHSTAPDDTIRELILLAEQEGWRASRLHIERLSMNDVFTHYTKKERSA